MNEQGVLVLVGAEALQLKDRLEASGYTTLEWGLGIKRLPLPASRRWLRSFRPARCLR
jgi:hypothetical protein